MSYSHHSEQHYIHRTGWLRAAVLGANDGIISVTSLIMGMAASGASTQTLLITCVAGLISGASSMAAGEYISVKSQVDIEKADLHMEARELERNPRHELKELTQIYVMRGLKPELAHEVAVQLRLAFMKIPLLIRYRQQALLRWPFHWVLFSPCSRF